MTEYELPSEVYRGMIRVALVVSVPALIVSNLGFLYADSVYVAIAIMMIAALGIAFGWYRLGYLNTDEWDEY